MYGKNGHWTKGHLFTKTYLTKLYNRFVVQFFSFVNLCLIFSLSLISSPLHMTAHSAKRVLAIVEASVRLSVRLSVTLLYCVKTVQAKITRSSLWTTPRTLVYRDKISYPWVMGFPSNEGVKEGSHSQSQKTLFCRYWLL